MLTTLHSTVLNMEYHRGGMISVYFIPGSSSGRAYTCIRSQTHIYVNINNTFSNTLSHPLIAVLVRIIDWWVLSYHGNRLAKKPSKLPSNGYSLTQQVCMKRSFLLTQSCSVDPLVLPQPVGYIINTVCLLWRCRQGRVLSPVSWPEITMSYWYSKTL